MIGTVYPGSQSPRFHSLISSVSVLQSCECDIGISLSTGVSQWNDLTGNGRHYTQGTAIRQPAYGAINLSGYPVLSFDGVNSDTTGDMMSSTFVLPAPGTTPTWIWGVIRIETSAGFDRILASNTSASNAQLIVSNAGSNINAFNTSSNQTGSLTLNTWSRFEAYFSNSTNDYAAWGNSTVSGTNAGNSSSAFGRIIGKQPGATPSKFSMAAIMYCNGKPTTNEIANLNNVAQGRFKILSL